MLYPFTGTCRAAGLPAPTRSGSALPVYGHMPSRGFIRAYVKRQCSARLRAHAEPRVYPRLHEAAMLCPFTGTCRAAGLPATSTRRWLLMVMRTVVVRG